jgi:hypothetical protein
MHSDYIVCSPKYHISCPLHVKYLGLFLFVSALSIPSASQFHGDITTLIIIIIPSMTSVPTTRWHGDACVYVPVKIWALHHRFRKWTPIRSDPIRSTYWKSVFYGKRFDMVETEHVRLLMMKAVKYSFLA